MQSTDLSHDVVILLPRSGFRSQIPWRDIGADQYDQWPFYGALEKEMTALLSGSLGEPSGETIPTNKVSTKGKATEQTSDQEGVAESPIKSMAQAVKEMVKETKLGEAKDLLSMIMLSLNDTRDAGDPDWYSSHAMFWTAHPWRLARGMFDPLMDRQHCKPTRHGFEHKEWISEDWKDGKFKILDYGCGNGIASHALFPHASEIVAIDNDRRMINIYSEIVKRQEHPVGLEAPMKAYHGDLMPDFPSREAPILTNQSPVEALDHGGFDLVVVMLAMDCFEILSLSANDRLRQLMFNLDQLINCLQDHGTLLVLDFQKATTQTNEATESEKPLWLPNKTDESWFMLRATKKPQGFQGAFFGGDGEMLNPEHMTPGMAEAILMAMMSAHEH
ncbi:MAG: hypothetical protein L6R38_002938 [Xanthoria sp. 2 TBL-2021]|nr:MAG: hypothetical protein L6R38_002938 [Xanthoria sp. 2 TBL-2021]